MFEKIKQDIQYLKHQNMMFKGIINGEITEFDDELYNQLKKVYFNGIPVSIYIKYCDISKQLDYNLEKIYIAFLSISNAFLVRGEITKFQDIYGMKNLFFEWLEVGDYVYDFTLMLKFKKDLFYTTFSPEQIHRYTKEEYLVDNETIKKYETHISTNVDELRPDGEKIKKYYLYISNIKSYAYNSGNTNFIRDVKEFLNLINYDDNKKYDSNPKSLKIV